MPDKKMPNPLGSLGQVIFGTVATCPVTTSTITGAIAAGMTVDSALNSTPDLASGAAGVATIALLGFFKSVMSEVADRLAQRGQNRIQPVQEIHLGRAAIGIMTACAAGKAVYSAVDFDPVGTAAASMITGIAGLTFFQSVMGELVTRIAPVQPVQTLAPSRGSGFPVQIVASTAAILGIGGIVYCASNSDVTGIAIETGIAVPCVLMAFRYAMHGVVNRLVQKQPGQGSAAQVPPDNGVTNTRVVPVAPTPPSDWPPKSETSGFRPENRPS